MLLTLFKLFLLVVRRSFALNFCHLPCSDSVPSSLSLSSRWLSKLPRGYSASLPRSTLSMFLLCPSSWQGRAGNSFCLPRRINCRVFHAAMFAIGPSLELLWVVAFFQGQCSRCDSSRLRRSDSIGQAAGSSDHRLQVICATPRVLTSRRGRMRRQPYLRARTGELPNRTSSMACAARCLLCLAQGR
ncbi:hypothetical protein SNOG_20070 [Parastagonospora nodorum SN15]|uniref:Secreted protein n=1 Tax=Phaeosphaeria nodorum (strain SN15 / ATCC MYA-4574 / FGSC 10173) TaxID=321614 RepID=A9JX67_PHANO|nr:hypothetical protein SNOG_20070 [Parastagonospora nodorum SN15]EDP89926.1 hypothetical protein SNOG_20070 [Parastagonospora nodorum SN15]